MPIMPHIADEYWPFYLTGYDERPLRLELDVEALAQKIIDGDTPLMEAVHKACAAAAAEVLIGAKKRKWLKENRQYLEAHDGEPALDEERAYRAYTEARVDILAMHTATLVVVEICGLVGDDDMSDDDASDDDDGDDEDDDDEDD